MSKALLVARPNDQLVVSKLDRLGRSLEHLIELSRTLQERDADLVMSDQGIDTSTAVGRMFFQILGAIAEFEHALMSERTRRHTYDERDDDGKRRYTIAQIAIEFSVTRPTIYRHLGKTTS